MVEGMNGRILIVICSLLGVIPLRMQAEGDSVAVFDRKALWKTVRTYVKADNYSKADETLREAFAAHAEAYADAELVRMEMDAQWQLALAENKKLFLNSKPDTAAYFARVLATTQYALRCDSLDQLPDEHGRTRPRYTKELGERLRGCRGNLCSGGKYFYKRGEYASAWTYLDLYLRSRHNHLLSGRGVPSDTPDSVAVARMATISAFSAGRPNDALRYVALAEQDTAIRCSLMEIEARAHGQLGERSERMEVVTRAHALYPAHDYFAMALIHHHDSLAEYSEALDVIHQTLAAGGDGRHYAFLAGRMYELLGQLDSAAVSYREGLDRAPDDAPLLAALGMLALRQATLLRSQTTAAALASSDDVRQHLQAYYESAAYYLGRARANAPQRPELWKEGLREAYFRLNRGQDLQSLEQ